MFRLLHPDAGLNYHTFTLARYPNGQVGTEDIHVAMTGEPLTQTFRRLMIPALKESKQGILDKLAGRDQLYLGNLPKIMAITKANHPGNDPSVGLSAFRSLPMELQKDKTLQLAAITVAQKVNDEEYLKEMERFRTNHSQDPAIDMMSIDYLLLKKEHRKAIESVERIEKSVGGDPYLNTLKGSIYIDNKQWDEAKASIAKTIQDEPTLTDGYWGMITVSLHQQAHADTLKWLKTVVETCGAEIEIESIQKEELYKDFVKTPQFKDLTTWYKNRPNSK